MHRLKEVITRIYENEELRQTCIPLFLSSPGMGKEISIETPILTNKGWIKAKDVKIGTIFYDEKGVETKVTAIYPQGIKRNFEITFSDGYTTNSGLEHLWNVKQSWQKEYVTYTLKEIIDKGINSTNTVRESSGRKPMNKFRIPITEPVQYFQKEYVIPPYFLGVLIGNGYLSENVSYSLNTEDTSVHERIINSIQKDYTFSCRYTSRNCFQFRLKNIENPRNNIYKKEIINLGLNVKSGFKFIPEKYKFGSIKDRIALLQGLMDTDGSVSKERNKVAYYTSSLQLANDVVELVQSLGGLAHIRTYFKSSKNPEYAVVVKINICPFYLKRKAEKWNKSVFSRAIAKISEIEPVESICFTVDSPGALYQLEHHIVTHNTAIIKEFAKEKGVKCLDIIASQLMPHEVSGMAINK